MHILYYVETNPGNPNDHTLYQAIESNSGVGLVGYVKEIGSNDEYIIIKSHRKNSSIAHQYYILEKEYNESYQKPKDNLIGPYDLSEFSKVVDSLKIQDIDFNIKIE